MQDKRYVEIDRSPEAEKIRKENRRENWICAAIGVGGLATILAGTYFALYRPLMIYKSALSVVDSNKDGYATADEWMEAYRKAGLVKDELNPVNPRKLTESELVKIINNNK